ncbi:GDSL-like Lipase/Acylhydrolase family protein [Mycobacterium xenopi 4042]|uniref:GDSL-like Lipase/Acylhydrolase family protein n=1 Tax=Mycobacterium xenopi 4042 TaxID=1299334 RepID=X8DMJ8_MYCXE|nr:GDSL-like Lipase/Acylhydrolase family protein [Mycobacterium xenopi 4042]
MDVTFSGATTANILAERQRGTPPQIDALDGSEALVTITIGGNDVGYIPLLMAAALPGRRGCCPTSARCWTAMPASRRSVRSATRCARSGGGAPARPGARVLFVDYLTMLPPAGRSAAPLSPADADLGRHVAARLEDLTAAAAEASGCELVRAGLASRDHHAWSSDPWTVGAAWPLPWRPAPFHPNAAGCAPSRKWSRHR